LPKAFNRSSDPDASQYSQYALIHKDFLRFVQTKSIMLWYAFDLPFGVRAGDMSGTALMSLPARGESVDINNVKVLAASDTDIDVWNRGPEGAMAHPFINEPITIEQIKRPPPCLGRKCDWSRVQFLENNFLSNMKT